MKGHQSDHACPFSSMRGRHDPPPSVRALSKRVFLLARFAPCERRKRRDLLAVFVEIARIEPNLVSLPDRRPVVIGDGVPSRIAIVPLDDLGVAEDPL